MGKIMCSEIDMSPPRETQNKVWASWQMLPEVLSRCALGHLWAWMMPEAPSCPGKEGEQASEELPEKSSAIRLNLDPLGLQNEIEGQRK